jgi:putative chitinase
MIELIDVTVLRAACPERSAAQLEPWVEPVKKACRRFEIDRIRRVAAFCATIAHESGFVPGREENMNYSPKRMSEVWPARFAVNGFRGHPNARANALAGKPEALANEVYANRMGNGDAASGDGWRFRGVGPLQLTGRANHAAFAKAMGLGLEESGAYIRTLEGGVMSAAWFWEENDINRLADTPGVEDEAKRINGGTVGIEDRKARFDRTVKRLLEREREA